MGDRDLVLLAQLEESEEGNGHLDAREPFDLLIEVEARPAAQPSDRQPLLRSAGANPCADDGSGGSTPVTQCLDSFSALRTSFARLRCRGGGRPGRRSLLVGRPRSQSRLFGARRYSAAGGAKLLGATGRSATRRPPPGTAQASVRAARDEDELATASGRELSPRRDAPDERDHDLGEVEPPGTELLPQDGAAEGRTVPERVEVREALGQPGIPGGTRPTGRPLESPWGFLRRLTFGSRRLFPERDAGGDEESPRRRAESL